MTHPFRRFAIALLIATVHSPVAVAETASSDAVEVAYEKPAPPETTVWLGGNIASWWLEDTGSFHEQLRTHRLLPPLFQAGMSLSVEHMLTSWFGIGGEFRWTPFSGERNDDIADRSDASDYSLDRLGVLAMALAQFGEDSYGSGYRMGIYAGVGGGPLLWSMRGNIDVGGEFLLEGGMFWRAFFGDVGLGARISWRAGLAEGLGPNDLSVPLGFSGGLEIQLGYRW